jgi:hypothetical protein
MNAARKTVLREKSSALTLQSPDSCCIAIEFEGLVKSAGYQAVTAKNIESQVCQPKRQA